jgi:hypothetical protein
MFGNRHSQARRIRWAAGMAAGTVGLAAAVAPQAFGTTSEAQPEAQAGTVGQRALEATQVDGSDAEVTHERGIVLAGTGTLDGRQVFVEIYGNDLYGSHAAVVVEQPGGPDLGATVELPIDDLLDGDIELEMALFRSTRGGHVATREHAQVGGSWEEFGPSTEIDETYEDAGYVIHTTGTNTPLSADVVVTAEGQRVTLQMRDAFAFDLTVTRTPL